MQNNRESLLSGTHEWDAKNGCWLWGLAGGDAIPARWSITYAVDGETRRASGRDTPHRTRGDDQRWENDDLILTCRFSANEAGSTLTGSLEAKRPLELQQIISLAFGAELPWLAQLERTTVFRNGFQSWTPTGAVPATTLQRYPLIASFALMNHYVDSPYWGRRDGLISSHYAVLKKDTNALLVGYLTQRVGLGEVFLRTRGHLALEASLDYGAKRLAAGERLELEVLRLRAGEPAGLVEGFADACGAAMGAAVPAEPSPVGWCSWYELYTKVNERDVIANLAAIRARPQLGVSVVQLDDGYQAALGDWQLLNKKFPRGLAPVASAIREAGFQAGLWSAPFFVSLRSQTARRHPEWLLRDERGVPVDCGFNPMWWTRAKALDTTHPGALAWLGEVFRGWVADGFDYFKIDFLFGALRHGLRHDASQSPVEAYRGGLRVIREAIGTERFLLGCGAPLGPSVGLFDAMRISEDVKEEWSSRFWSALSAGCSSPSARGAIADDVTRAFLHRRWWLNDPDCLLVRARHTKLTADEIQTLVTVLGLTGGMLFLSDDLSRLAPERLTAVERILPPSMLTAAAPTLLEESYPTRFEVSCGGRRVVAHLNWEGKSVSRDLTVNGTAFDFWAGEVIDAGRLTIPRHGVRAIIETASVEVPHLVGTDLNLVALVDGRLVAEFAGEGGRLRVSGRQLARRAGVIWIAVPARWRLAEETLPAAVTAIRPWSGGLVVEVMAEPPWELELRFAATRPS